MKLLVVGASGLLGSNLIHRANSYADNIYGTFYETKPSSPIPTYQLDLRSTDSIRDVINRTDPTVIINAAAMTDVDECEQRPETAMAVNADGPALLARVCQEAGIDFIHISTDYVFDGLSESRYSESADPNPRQQYGRSKHVAERRVNDIHDAPLIIRTSYLYGFNRARSPIKPVGFPTWVIEECNAGERLSLYTDQWVTPARAKSTAETILDLYRSGSTGIYHVASRSCVTPFEFGNLIRKETGFDEKHLVRSSVSTVDRSARRPRNTCLCVTKVESELAEQQPSLRSEFSAFLANFP